MTDTYTHNYKTNDILKKWRDANLECHRLRSISIRPRQRVNIHRKIVDLCKFYLSNVNLVQDSATRNLMDRDGSILLSALLLKPKMRRVASGDSHLIAEALRENENDELGIFQGLLRSNPSKDNHKADFVLSKDQRRVRRVREYNERATLLGACAASAAAAIQSSRHAKDVTRKAEKYMCACAASSAALSAYLACIDSHRASKAAKVAFSAALAVAKKKLVEEEKMLQNNITELRSTSILGRGQMRKTRLESMAKYVMMESSEEEEEEGEKRMESVEEENENLKFVEEEQTSLKQCSEQFGGLPRSTERFLNTLRRNATRRDEHGILLYKGDSLHSASLKADKYRVQALLHLGADPNRRDKNDMTPLHYAVEGGSQYVTALLLLQNANLGNVDKWKSTPLHYAVENRNMNMVRLLVNAGAPLSIVSIHGQTPIDLAIDRNYQDIADWMILNKPQSKKKEHEKKAVGSLLVGKFRRSSMQRDPELARAIREKTELELFEDEVRSNVLLASQTKNQSIRTRKKSLLIGDLATLHRRGFSMYV